MKRVGSIIKMCRGKLGKVGVVPGSKKEAKKIIIRRIL